MLYSVRLSHLGTYEDLIKIKQKQDTDTSTACLLTISNAVIASASGPINRALDKMSSIHKKSRVLFSHKV